MNIENMEQEFPKMPQSMRDMIEKEVEKQVKVTPQRGYFSLKKAVVASKSAPTIRATATSFRHLPKSASGSAAKRELRPHRNPQ